MLLEHEAVTARSGGGRISMNSLLTQEERQRRKHDDHDDHDDQHEDEYIEQRFQMAREYIRDFIHSFGTAEALLAAMSPVELRNEDLIVPEGARGLRKRKREVLDSVSVAPLRVSRAATSKWLALLRLSLSSESIQHVHSTVRPMLSRSKDWRKRCRFEIASVEKLMNVIRKDPPKENDLPWLLHGSTYTNSCEGRTLTYYPQLCESAFVQRLSKATRHAITNQWYLEIDLSTAHIAAAWGAVEHNLGQGDAERLCPKLKIAATNKMKAREIVARENRCDPSYAKRLILMTLNQESGDGIHRTGFLNSLINERPAIMKALTCHPSIVGTTHASIVERCEGLEKHGVREMALMLQHLEAQMLRISVPVLSEHGFEVGAFIADGMLVRQADASGNDGTICQLQKALVAVQSHIHSELHVSATMEIEHC